MINKSCLIVNLWEQNVKELFDPLKSPQMDFNPTSSKLSSQRYEYKYNFNLILYIQVLVLFVMLIKSNSLSKNENSHTLMSLQTHMIFFLVWNRY